MNIPPYKKAAVFGKFLSRLPLLFMTYKFSNGSSTLSIFAIINIPGCTLNILFLISRPEAPETADCTAEMPTLLLCIST
ncbi:MAG TPA: hypothetical protein DDX68_10305 [Clostridium sp.]|nr:hypothetical protein [Clostridium sp.]